MGLRLPSVRERSPDHGTRSWWRSRGDALHAPESDESRNPFPRCTRQGAGLARGRHRRRGVHRGGPRERGPDRPATAAARSAAVLEEATGTAGIIRGTFLPDGAARSEISDETGASTVTVPAAADGRVTVTSADGTEVGIGLPGSGAAAQQSDNGTIVDPDAHDSSEFGVQATADGVSALVSMKDVEAPTAGRQEHLSARRTADGPARNQQGDGRERREERKEDQGEHARHLEVQERQDLGGWSTGTGTWCRSAVTSERRTTTL